MSDEEKEEGAPRLVICRRTGEKYSSEEHHRCPYCFGDKTEVVPGEHAAFCDYDPAKDPTHFGFPTDATRPKSG
jgi:hypothetical protein